MQKKLAGIAATTVAAITLTACAMTPPPIVAHGTVELMQSQYFGGLPTDPNVTDGGQVIVTDPAGKVLTTGTLSFDTASTGLVAAEVFTFTVTVPAGENRYGIQVSGVPGTVWETPGQMKQGPQLSVQSS